ncbi:MAG: phosphoglycerate kinase [Deltaproteobacteria bacterium]|jgi:phosphoglycerate kinase
MKKTIKDIEVADKRVLVRVDFNVPLQNGAVADDTRIRSTLPTIEHLISHGAKVILCSHLGRPKGKPDEKFRLDPVAERLSELLHTKVGKLDDCVGPEVESAVENLEPGGVLLLENTRFHPGEKENDPEFASRLAKLADIYVNDAFGAAHRAHASTEGVAHYLPAVAGLLMERELDVLSRTLEHPEHPFVAIFGGAKISDKIGVVERLLDRLDKLLVGGGMANTLLRAQNLETGKSLVEEESLETGRRILNEAVDKLVLPVDVVIAEEFKSEAETKVVLVDRVPPDWRILDIGPQTIDLFKDKLKSVKTLVWNGPLGAAELEPFAQGTKAVAQCLGEQDGVFVVGGGDTVAVLNQLGLAGKMTHLSTGGGAFLEFLEGKELPGVAVLQDR